MDIERQPAELEALLAMPLPDLEANNDGTGGDVLQVYDASMLHRLRHQFTEALARVESPQAVRRLWVGIAAVTSLAFGSLLVQEAGDAGALNTASEMASPAGVPLPLTEQAIEVSAPPQLPPVLPLLPDCPFPIRSTQECLAPLRPHEIPPLQRLEPVNSAEQALINEILAQVTPTPEEYARFKINTSRAHVLDGILPHETIWPEMYVTHWVGYEPLCDSIDDCLGRMSIGGLSYGLFTMQDGTTYQISPAIHSRTNHARGANYASVGHSMNANSLETILAAPIMLEQMIYGNLWHSVEHGLPLTRDRSLSHAEIVRDDGTHKQDFNSALQDGVFNLILELNHRVYVNGEGGHPSPFTP